MMAARIILAIAEDHESAPARPAVISRSVIE
jgi:hypothetical protein